MLRRVIAVDAPAALAILTEGLSGWDALECDLAEAAARAIGGTPSSAAATDDGGGRSATQVKLGLWGTRQLSMSIVTESAVDYNNVDNNNTNNSGTTAI